MKSKFKKISNPINLKVGLQKKIIFLTFISFILFFTTKIFAEKIKFTSDFQELKPDIRHPKSDTSDIEIFLQHNNIKPQQSKEGIYFKIEKEGSGELPKTGDYLKINYVGKLIDGKIFDKSAPDEPFVFQLGYRQVLPCWDLMLGRFKIGSKITLFVPSELAYGKSGTENIPPDAPLIFEIDIQSVLSAGEYDSYMRSLESKEKQIFEQRSAEQFIKDKQIINDYVMSKKLKAQRTSSGVSFLITKVGKGDNIRSGNTVAFNYDGMFLDEKIFDSNKNRSPFSFTVGEGKIIAGLEEALTHFNKGSEGIIIIPSKLAYGATPLDDSKIIIPAFSILLFKVQVVDINK